RRVEWGSAPILLQATNTPGKITVIAKSWKAGATYAVTPDTITIESVKPTLTPLYKERPTVRERTAAANTLPASSPTISEAERQKMLEEVNKQQMEFGIGN
ncbi:MAG: glycoside hydrolase family 2, partial [Prevotella sp.]|nr:glycoside hydrolase family 2 [Prevotella sp.]